MHEPVCLPSTTVANAHPTTTAEERPLYYIYTHGEGVIFGQDVYMGMARRCVIAHAATTIPYHTNMVDAATPPRALLMKVRSPMAFGQSTVNMLDAAPAVLEPMYVRNCERPIILIPFNGFYKMRVEAVPRLDLAKHDVIHPHHPGAVDGLVGCLVVWKDPWPQRPARASVAHWDSRLQLRLDQLVPHLPQP